MPGAFTHIFMAQLCLEQDAKNYPWLLNNKNLIWLGAQGPDPYFFTGTLPWKPRESQAASANFGSLLHSQLPSLTLLPVLETLLETKEKVVAETWQDLASWVYGYMLHYILDRTVHPYVFYQSGFDQAGELSGPWAGLHARFETNLDHALIKSPINSLKQIKLEKLLSLEKSILHAISKLLGSTYKDEFATTAYLEGSSDMLASAPLLRDNWGVKDGLASLFIPKTHIIRGMLRPATQSLETSAYVRNTAENPWQDPCTGETKTLSVEKLINQACEEAKPLMNFLVDKNKLQDFEAYLGNINYDGCPEGSLKKYKSSALST